MDLLEFLTEYCFSIEINCNDVFGYACAESTSIDPNDIPKLLEIQEKYGWEGIKAFCSCVKGGITSIWKEADWDKVMEELKDYAFWSIVKCSKNYHSVICNCEKE